MLSGSSHATVELFAVNHVINIFINGRDILEIDDDTLVDIKE